MGWGGRSRVESLDAQGNQQECKCLIQSGRDFTRPQRASPEQGLVVSLQVQHSWQVGM